MPKLLSPDEFVLVTASHFHVAHCLTRLGGILGTADHLVGFDVTIKVIERNQHGGFAAMTFNSHWAMFVMNPVHSIGQFYALATHRLCACRMSGSNDTCVYPAMFYRVMRPLWAIHHWESSCEIQICDMSNFTKQPERARPNPQSIRAKLQRAWASQ